MKFLKHASLWFFGFYGLFFAQQQLIAADDGSQLETPFRVNFAGYHPQASKMALFLSPYTGPISWSLVGTDCIGTAKDYVAHDRSSGDSFYIIDFSHCTENNEATALKVGEQRSLPFSITENPLQGLQYEFFDYFRTHETSATFSHTVNNWADLSLTFRYVKDAGDNGVYPVNTAEAAWSLINLLETYPNSNHYYAKNKDNARTIYEQLLILTEQFHHVMNNPRNLAIAKLHTNVASYGPCAPHPNGSTCISEPETKATYATARTLAAMARLHLIYADKSKAMAAYETAKKAIRAARSEPFTCNQADKFGGEGGMYPDNDVWAMFRHPQKLRDNCYPNINNTSDDEYAALVELHITASALKNVADANGWRDELLKNQHFAQATSFWWGAVAMEGNLSLLTHSERLNIDMSLFKTNLQNKAQQIIHNQSAGYPGVTWEPNSTQWNNGDLDSIDNNIRWGSHRMALNDARILIVAASIEKQQNNKKSAAKLARAAVKVLDHIGGINAMNLAMYTAKDYSFIEHAVERTHDGADPEDLLNGKMILGPNNWTNANDKDMPAFGSQPGLKMMAVTGTGWASREISIDANAALIAIAYFASEEAADFYALDPL